MTKAMELTNFARCRGAIHRVASCAVEHVPNVGFARVEVQSEILAHGLGHSVAVFTGLEALLGNHLDFGTSKAFSRQYTSSQAASSDKTKCAPILEPNLN